MRTSLWGLGILVLGVIAALFSGGNLFVLGLSGLLILLGIFVAVVAEVAKWFHSHGIFHPPKTYGGLTYTKRGEAVRSNSERTIADYFNRNNIRYVYEQPAFNRWSGRRISRPDFYLPDYGIYVEYWGMVGAEDAGVRSRYERSMKWKMAQYHRSNIKFISIYPDNMNNLDWVFRVKFREIAGYDLPSGQTRPVTSSYCINCGASLTQKSIFCQSCGFRVAA